jgi:hypothetical protein
MVCIAGIYMSVQLCQYKRRLTTVSIIGNCAQLRCLPRIGTFILSRIPLK